MIFKKILKKRGEVLWKKLNRKLPSAVGVVENDMPRMAAFAERVKKMSKINRLSLKIYLEYLLEFYDESGDVVSGSTEAFCMSQRQIFRSHLQYL